jgi:DNA polymerase
MKKHDYLENMGINVWRLRTPSVHATVNELNIDWQHLTQQAINCTICDLHKTRKHVVFGVGNPKAELLIIGEAPGAQEDAKGEPFVGKAGQLLNNMLKAISLSREKVYIANILKCRPPNNRDPKPEEITSCTPFLTKQINFIQPKVILALGRFAAHFLLKCDIPMGKLRNKTHQYGEQDIPLIVTYHPAYLLRAPKDKYKAWQDLQQLKATLNI